MGYTLIAPGKNAIATIGASTIVYQSKQSIPIKKVTLLPDSDTILAINHFTLCC
jgi:hypothetical protein